MQPMQGAKVLFSLALSFGLFLVPSTFGKNVNQTAGLEQVASEDLPPVGTYWVMLPDGNMAPPMPIPPLNDTPVYALPDGSFLVDETGLSSAQNMAMSLSDSIPSPEDGGETLAPPPPPVPDTRRNYEKFQRQGFQVVDTNNAAVNDPNLYNACAAFPANIGSNPSLQLRPYGTNATLIKASHFDYSGETRDFALLITDDVSKPIWKTIDFSGTSDAQDGWLVQGLVPNGDVSDAMFFLITDINPTCNAFFTAIPYAGPQITLAGFAPNATVGGTIALTAQIRDLSGITNEQFEVTVDGDPARYTATNNTITLDTRYNPNDVCSVYLRALNKASVYDLSYVPAKDAKLFFRGSDFLPLQFQNPTYMVWSGDNASPEIGMIYSLFYVDRPRTIEAYVYDPKDNHILASYYGDVPYATLVEIDWDFKETDGVTPCTNDAYAVWFDAYDSQSRSGSGMMVNAAPANPDGPLSITNTIAKQGVRAATGNILSYEEEDPSLSGAPYLNSEAKRWVDTMAFAYESLYYDDWGSQTCYNVNQIGPNRDNNPSRPMPIVLTQATQPIWAGNTLTCITNAEYSDFSWYMGHANGYLLGGGSGTNWVTAVLDSQSVARWALAAGRNWRMRKVCLWGCYTDSGLGTSDGVARTLYGSWASAFGVRPTRTQTMSLMKKNVGLFFTESLRQGGYSGTLGGGTCPEVSCTFDDIWINGPSAWPGECDPTYAFSWALNVTEGMSPELLKALPTWIGFGYLPYSGVYDDELMVNDISHIKR